MTTHSPLPWTRRVPFDSSWFIDAAGGKGIIIVPRRDTVYEDPEPGVRIQRDVKREHADADAALFFAAPKLLEAAKQAEMLIRNGGIVPVKGMTWVALTEAIELAETVIDGDVEAKAERARRDAEINAEFGAIEAFPSVQPPAPGEVP